MNISHAITPNLDVLGVDPKVVARYKRIFQLDIDSLGMYEFSLLLIKHSCLSNREEIIESIESSNLHIVATEKKSFDRKEAVRFALIRAHGKNTALNVPEHSATLESLLAGPLEGVIVSGPDAVNKLSNIVGSNDPPESREKQPHSLRRRFGGENGLQCSANRNEAHEELSTVFPNYVDLLRSKGYSDQVEQWLFNLWKSGPSRSLLKTSHIDVRRYSKTSAESSTNMLGVVKSVSSFLKHKVFNCISTISSIIPSTPSASPASLKAVPSELPPLFISPQLSREDEEEIAEAALADELGLRDLSALRKADADFNPFHQEEPGPSPRNSRPNISNNDTDSENELPFHDATNTAPHANEEGPSVKPPSEPDASSVFDLYAEQNNFFSEYSIRMRQGKRMARNFLRPMPDNTESAVEMFRPTYSRPRSPVLPLVPLSTRRTDHVPVRREQQPVNLNALLKREAESITDDILSMHDNNGATQ